MIHAQQQAHPGQRHQQARAAIAHERQRQPFGRQHAHVDAHVDEGLQSEPDPEACREIGLELHARIGGELGDVQCAPDQREEQRERQRHADEPEFLGQHREQEVRVRFGQIEQLLHALAQAHAEPLAAPDRDQRLRQLEAAVERIGPGIQESRDAPHPVARRGRDDRECRAHHHTERGDVTQSRARDEQHAEARDEQHRGCAEIRLGQQQHEEQREHAERLQQAGEAVPQLLLPPCGIARDEDQHQYTGEFRNLEIEAEDAQPAASAIDRMADARNQHQYQQHTGDDQQRLRELFQQVGADAEHQRGERATHQGQHELALEIAERTAAEIARRLGPRHRNRGRGHHDEAEQQDAADQHHRDGIDPYTAAASRAAFRTHEMSSRTAEANTAPRCA